MVIIGRLPLKVRVNESGSYYIVLKAVAGQVAQWVTCLLYKPGSLSLIDRESTNLGPWGFAEPGSTPREHVEALCMLPTHL